MKGKLIVIEGTDCSGKETQVSLLVQRLKKEGHKVERFGFPMYDTPTGKIIGGAYLGKEYIGEGVFSSNESFNVLNIPSSVISIGAYAFDSCINISKIKMN